MFPRYPAVAEALTPRPVHTNTSPSATFHRDVSQIMNLISLPFNFAPQASTIGEFIAKFESEWQTLSTMASTGSDTYRTDFKTFLSHDKTKCDFLLSFLVRHPDWKNIVDNLTTTDALSYSNVKCHLLSTASDALEKALSTVQPSNKKK